MKELSSSENSKFVVYPQIFKEVVIHLWIK